MDNKETLIELTDYNNIGKETVQNILTTVKSLPIMSQTDMTFLSENKDHLGKVLERTYMWRTDFQKVSIINHNDFPTLHAKFHQAILEQKVQFENAMFLAKDFEELKINIELLECDLEDLGELDTKRKKLQAEKIRLDINFKKYQLENMRIAMDYRMKEIRGWQEIENMLIKEMKVQGMTEEQIWDKQNDELTASFILAINRLGALTPNSSPAERHNIITFAVHAYTVAESAGKLEEILKQCNEDQLEAVQLIKDSLNNESK